jgi:hypothetical protein
MDISTPRGQRERTTGSLEFSSNASRPTLITSDQDDEGKSLHPAERLLCARCAAVDFDGALSNELEDILIGDMGSIKEWSIDSCSFCKLVASISTNDNGIQYECSLRTVNSSKLPNWIYHLSEHYLPECYLEYITKAFLSTTSLHRSTVLDQFDLSKLALSTIRFSTAG